MGNFLSRIDYRIFGDNLGDESIINMEYKLIDDKIFFNNSKSLLTTVMDKDKCAILINTLNDIIKSGSHTFDHIQFNPYHVDYVNNSYNLTPVAYLCNQLDRINNSNIQLMVKFMIYNNFNSPKTIFTIDGNNYNELMYSIYIKKPHVTKMLLAQNKSKLLDTFNIALKGGNEDICKLIIDKDTLIENNIMYYRGNILEGQNSQKIEPTHRFINNYIKYCSLHNMQDLYLQITTILLDPILIQLCNSTEINILNVTVYYSQIYNNYNMFISLIINFKYSVRALNKVYEAVSTNNVIKKILRIHIGSIFRKKLISKLDEFHTNFNSNSDSNM